MDLLGAAITPTRGTFSQGRTEDVARKLALPGRNLRRTVVKIWVLLAGLSRCCYAELQDPTATAPRSPLCDDGQCSLTTLHGSNALAALLSHSLSLSPSGLHFAHVSLGAHLCFCGHGACFRAPPSAKGRHHFKSLSKYPTLSAFEVNSHEWLTHESCRNDIKIMSTVGYSQVGFISLVHACMIIIHACVRCGPI